MMLHPSQDVCGVISAALLSSAAVPDHLLHLAKGYRRTLAVLLDASPTPASLPVLIWRDGCFQTASTAGRKVVLHMLETIAAPLDLPPRLSDVASVKVILYAQPSLPSASIIRSCAAAVEEVEVRGGEWRDTFLDPRFEALRRVTCFHPASVSAVPGGIDTLAVHGLEGDLNIDLCRLTKLQHLTITSEGPLSGTTPSILAFFLSRARKLRTLTVTASPAQWPVLAKLPRSLEEVTLAYGRRNIDSIADAISQCARLSRLSLTVTSPPCPISSALASAILGISSLSALRLRFSHPLDVLAEAWRTHPSPPRLRHLTLEWTSALPPPSSLFLDAWGGELEVFDTSLPTSAETVLRHFPRLRRLAFCPPPLSPTSLPFDPEAIASHGSLRFVRVRNMMQEDARCVEAMTAANAIRRQRRKDIAAAQAVASHGRRFKTLPWHDFALRERVLTFLGKGTELEDLQVSHAQCF